MDPSEEPEEEEESEEEEEEKAPPRSLGQLIVLQLKILSFCASKEELLSLGKREFNFGIVLVLLAGIGRFWDDPTADILLKSGLTSPVYVFFLATFIWMLIGLIGPRNWKWGRIIAFVAMTAPPAFIYAIPVEQFMTPYQAELTNVWFLVGVATWRVLLLIYFVARTAELDLLRIGVAILIPLTTIVNGLIFTEHLSSSVAMMGGVRRELRKIASAPDQATGFSGFSRTGTRTGTGRRSGTRSGIRSGVRSGGTFGAQRSAGEKNVTAATTGWLSNHGKQVAQGESPGLNLQNIIPSSIQKIDTVNTPDGPVDIYSDWSLIRSEMKAAPPPGYEEISTEDPIYKFRHPLIRLVEPVAGFCMTAFWPLVGIYFILIFWRPKRVKEPPAAEATQT
jgi:hypothetical protein